MTSQPGDLFADGPYSNIVEADQLLQYAAGTEVSNAGKQLYVARAHAHATLALAMATLEQTERMRPHSIQLAAGPHAPAVEGSDLMRAGEPLPLHRTEAGYPRCATCDGGGCPDCTDPS